MEQRPLDIYLKQQGGEEEKPLSQKIREVSQALHQKRTSPYNPDTSVTKGVQPDYFPNEDRLSDWQKENLDKIQQEKYLASQQNGFELAGNMIAGGIFKSFGYLSQGAGAIADLITPDDEERNQLFEKRNPLYEAGKSINDWSDNFFPQYAKRPEIAQRGEVDWGDIATYSKLATEVGAQVLPSIIPGMAGSTAARLAFGGGLTMAKYIPKANAVLEGMQASGQLLNAEQTVSTLGALFSMAGVNAKRTQIDKEDELKQKYYSDKGYYEKLYGTTNPDIIDHEIKKAGDLVYYTTFGLNLATGAPLAKLMGSPKADMLNKFREGITKANVAKDMKDKLFKPMLGEALEEGGETILEKSADELLKIRGAKLKNSPDPNDFGNIETPSLEEYVTAVKDSFIKNALADETKLAMLGGLFGGGFEVLGTGVLQGGDEGFRKTAKDQKEMYKFLDNKLSDPDENTMGGLLGKYIRNTGRLMFETDPKVMSKRDSFTNIASAIGTAMGVSLEHRGFDVYKEQAGAIKEALDRHIVGANNGTLKTEAELTEAIAKDPNNEEARKQLDDIKMLKGVYEDKTLNDKLKATTDESTKKQILNEHLTEHRDNLDMLLSNADSLRDQWVQLREKGVSTDTLNKYLNLSIKSLLLDNLHNTPEIAQYREEYKTWKEEAKDVSNAHEALTQELSKPKTDKRTENRFKVLEDLDKTIEAHQKDLDEFTLNLQKELEANEKGYTAYLSKLDPRGWFSKKKPATSQQSTKKGETDENTDELDDTEEAQPTGKIKAKAKRKEAGKASSQPSNKPKKTNPDPNTDDEFDDEGDPLNEPIEEGAVFEVSDLDDETAEALGNQTERVDITDDPDDALLTEPVYSNTQPTSKRKKIVNYSYVLNFSKGGQQVQLAVFEPEDYNIGSNDPSKISPFQIVTRYYDPKEGGLIKVYNGKRHEYHSPSVLFGHGLYEADKDKFLATVKDGKVLIYVQTDYFDYNADESSFIRRKPLQGEERPIFFVGRYDQYDTNAITSDTKVSLPNADVRDKLDVETIKRLANRHNESVKLVIDAIEAEKQSKGLLEGAYMKLTPGKFDISDGYTRVQTDGKGNAVSLPISQAIGVEDLISGKVIWADKYEWLTKEGEHLQNVKGPISKEPGVAGEWLKVRDKVIDNGVYEGGSANAKYNYDTTPFFLVCTNPKAEFKDRKYFYVWNTSNRYGNITGEAKENYNKLIALNFLILRAYDLLGGKKNPQVMSDFINNLSKALEKNNVGLSILTRVLSRGKDNNFIQIKDEDSTEIKLSKDSINGITKDNIDDILSDITKELRLGPDNLTTIDANVWTNLLVGNKFSKDEQREATKYLLDLNLSNTQLSTIPFDKSDTSSSAPRLQVIGKGLVSKKLKTELAIAQLPPETKATPVDVGKGKKAKNTAEQVAVRVGDDGVAEGVMKIQAEGTTIIINNQGGTIGTININTGGTTQGGQVVTSTTNPLSGNPDPTWDSSPAQRLGLISTVEPIVPADTSLNPNFGKNKYSTSSFYRYGTDRGKQLNSAEQSLLMRHLVSHYFDIFNKEGGANHGKTLSILLGEDGFISYLAGRLDSVNNGELITSLRSDLANSAELIKTYETLGDDKSKAQLINNLYNAEEFSLIRELEKRVLRLGFEITAISLDEKNIERIREEYEKATALNDNTDTKDVPLDASNIRQSEMNSFDDDAWLAYDAIKSSSSKVRAFLSFIEIKEGTSPLGTLPDFYSVGRVLNLMGDFMRNSSNIDQFKANLADIGNKTSRKDDNLFLHLLDRINNIEKGNEEVINELYQVFSKQLKDFRIIQLKNDGGFEVIEAGNYAKVLFGSTKVAYTRKLENMSPQQREEQRIKLSTAYSYFKNLKTDDNFESLYNDWVLNSNLTSETKTKLLNNAEVKKAIKSGSLRYLTYLNGVEGLGLDENSLENLLNSFVLSDGKTMEKVKSSMLEVISFFFPTYNMSDLDIFLTKEVMNIGSESNYKNISEIVKGLLFHTFAELRSNVPIDMSVLKDLPFDEQVANLKVLTEPLFSRQNMSQPSTFREGGNQYNSVMKHDQISLFLYELKNAKSIDDGIVQKLINAINVGSSLTHNYTLCKLLVGKLYELNTEESIAEAKGIESKYLIGEDTNVIKSFYKDFSIGILHQAKTDKRNTDRHNPGEMSPLEREVCNIGLFLDALPEAGKFNNYYFASPTTSDREAVSLYWVKASNEDQLRLRFDNLVKGEKARIKRNIDKLLDVKGSLTIKYGKLYTEMQQLGLSPKVGVSVIEDYIAFKKQAKLNDKELYVRICNFENKVMNGFVNNVNCNATDFVSLYRFLEGFDPKTLVSTDLITGEKKTVTGLKSVVFGDVELDKFTFEQFKETLIAEKKADLIKVGILKPDGKTVRGGLPKHLSKLTDPNYIFLYEANTFFNNLDYQTMYASEESYKGKDLFALQTEAIKRRQGATGQREQFAFTKEERYYKELLIADHIVSLLDSPIQSERDSCVNIANDFLKARKIESFVFTEESLKEALSDKKKFIASLDLNIQNTVSDILDKTSSYTDINTGDAQEYQSLEEALWLTIACGKMKADEVKLPSSAMLNDDLAVDREISSTTYGEFNQAYFDNLDNGSYKGGLWYYLTFGGEPSEKTKELLKKNLHQEFIMKMIYSGNDINGSTVVSNYIKSSTITLTSTFTKGGQLDNFRKVMNLTGIPRICYESARKSTHGMPLVAYDNRSVKPAWEIVAQIGQDLEGSANVLTLDRTYLGFQKVPKTKQDTATKFATQVCKTMKSMLALSGTDSANAKLVNEAEAILMSIVKQNAEELYEQLSINKEGKIDKLKEFVSLIREEVIKRNLGDHFLSYLELKDGEFEMPPIFNPIYNKLESVFTSVFNNRIMSFDMPGGSFVLTSEAGLRNKDSKPLDSVIITDDNSRYKKEGVLADDEVLISWCFDEPLSTNEKERAEQIKQAQDSGLLNILGYRTPCQGPNSMGAFKIVGILPPSHKATVVCSPTIIVRAGSDFDADTLYFYRYSHDKNFRKIDSGEKIQKQIDSINKKIEELNKKVKKYPNTIKRLNSEKKELEDKKSKLSIETLKNRLLDKYIAVAKSKEFEQAKYLPNGPGPIDTVGKQLQAIYATKRSYSPYSSQHQRKGYYEGVVAKSGVSVFTSVMGGLMKRCYEDPEFGTKAVRDNILENIQYFQSASVDNQKYGLLGTVNVGPATYPVIISLLEKGHTVEDILCFLNTPIIRELVENMNNTYIGDWAKGRAKLVKEFMDNRKLTKNDEAVFKNLTVSDIAENVTSKGKIELTMTDSELVSLFSKLLTEGGEITDKIGSANIQGNEIGTGMSEGIVNNNKAEKLQSDENDKAKTEKREPKQMIKGFDQSLLEYGLSTFYKLTEGNGKLTFNFDGHLNKIAKYLGIAEDENKFFQLVKEFHKFVYAFSHVNPKAEYNRLINKKVGDKDNIPLVERIQLLKVKLGPTYVANNEFLNRITSSESKYNPNEVFLSFNTFTQEGDYSRDEIVESFLAFADATFEQDWNNIDFVKEGTTQAERQKYYNELIADRNDIVNDLILYAYLYNPDAPNSIRPFIPIQLLRDSKILENFSNIDLKEDTHIEFFKDKVIKNNSKFAKTVELDERDGLNKLFEKEVGSTFILPDNYAKEGGNVIILVKKLDEREKGILIRKVGKKYVVVKKMSDEKEDPHYFYDASDPLPKPAEEANDEEETIDEALASRIEKFNALFSEHGGKVANVDAFIDYLKENATDLAIIEYFNALSNTKEGFGYKKLREYLSKTLILKVDKNSTNFSNYLRNELKLDEDQIQEFVKVGSSLFTETTPRMVAHTDDQGRSFIFIPDTDNIFNIDNLVGTLIEETLHVIDQKEESTYGLNKVNSSNVDAKIVELTNLLPTVFGVEKAYLTNQIDLLKLYKIACEEGKGSTGEVQYSLSNFFEFKARALTDNETTKFLKNIKRDDLKLSFIDSITNYLKILYKNLIDMLIPNNENNIYFDKVKQSLLNNYIFPTITTSDSETSPFSSSNSSYNFSSPFNNNFASPNKEVETEDTDEFLRSITEFYKEMVKEETLGNLPSVSKVMLQQSLNDIIASDTFDSLSGVLKQEMRNIQVLLQTDLAPHSERYLERLFKNYKLLLESYDDLLVDDEVKELVEELANTLNKLEKTFRKKQADVISKKVNDGNDILKHSFKDVNNIFANILDLSRVDNPLAQRLAEIQNTIKTETNLEIKSFEDELQPILRALNDYAVSQGLDIKDLYPLFLNEKGDTLIDEVPESISKELNKLINAFSEAEPGPAKTKAREKLNKFKLDNYAVQVSEKEYFKLNELLGRIMSLDSDFYNTFTNVLQQVEGNGNLVIKDSYHEGRYGKFLSIAEDLIKQAETAKDNSSREEFIELLRTHFNENDPIVYMQNLRSNAKGVVFSGSAFLQSTLKNEVPLNEKFVSIQQTKSLKDFYDFYRATLSEGRSNLPLIYDKEGGLLDPLYIPEVQSNNLRKATNSFEKNDILGSSRNILRGMFNDFHESITDPDSKDEKSVPIYGFSQNRTHKEDLLEALVQFKVMSEQTKRKQEYVIEAENIKTLIHKTTNPNILSGGQHSNLDKMAEYFVDAYFYGLTKEKNKIKVPFWSRVDEDGKEHNTTISSLLDYLISWVRKIGISFSTTIALADMMAGFTCNQREAARGRTFGYRDLIGAYAEVLGDNWKEFSVFGGSILFSMGTPLAAGGAYIGHKLLAKKTGRVYKFSKLLGVESRTSEATMMLKSKYMKNNWSKLSPDKDDFFVMQQISGRINAYSTMVAYLKKKQVSFVNNNGEGITMSAYDLLNEEGDFNNLDMMEGELDVIIKELTQEANDLVGNIHGNYDQDKPILMNKYVLGRVAGLFKSWLWRGLEQRYGGYKVIRGQEFEGNYTTTFLALKKATKLFFNRSNWHKLDIAEIGKLAIYVGILSPFHIKGKEEWGSSLTNLEKENIRITLMECYQYLTMMGLSFAVLAFAQGIDLEDEEDKTIPEKLLYHNLRKMYVLTEKSKKEIGLYIFYEDLVKTVANPIPITRLGTNLAELGAESYNLSKAMAGLEHHDTDFDKGGYKGQNKARIKLQSLIPVVSGLTRLDENNMTLQAIRERLEKKEEKEALSNWWEQAKEYGGRGE